MDTSHEGRFLLMIERMICTYATSMINPRRMISSILFKEIKISQQCEQTKVTIHENVSSSHPSA